MLEDPIDGATADASVLPLASLPESHAFRFTGKAGEFFGIWIVNLFLTIITFGIYSAWAKVRKKRYFYGHTWVADANFEYHGNPIAILKGRLIAFAAFAAYSGVGHFMPKVAAALALVLFVAAPWFIARSMAFNAFNSSYRNIRFRFQATYMDVLKAIWPVALVLVFPLLMPEFDQTGKVPMPKLVWMILGLQMLAIFAVYPYAIGALKKLHVNHSQYGAAPFSIEVGIGAFYKIYLMTMLLLFGAIFAIGTLAGFVVIASAAAGKGGGVGISLPIFIGLLTVLVYFGMGSLLLAYTKSRVGNLVFNNTRLGGQVSFTSNLGFIQLMWLYLVNMFAILFSLGLAVPWAVIRVMRYRAECLTLRSTASVDEFIGGVSAQVSATGEELGEFFNIDLSL
jgi:uncharacterized membrane protein YjgN (DUF898 family)